MFPMHARLQSGAALDIVAKRLGMAAVLTFYLFAPTAAVAGTPPSAGSNPQPPAVVITETESAFTLDNGIVTTRASKHSGDLLSLKYHGLEMLDAGSSPRGGYWSHNIANGEQITRITIDPKTNGGQRGEVSLKGIYTGTPMGSGPGGSAIADIEIRYALERGVSGVYTYSIFEHKTNYPGTAVGEARFCAKLNDDVFDWMTVDARRNMKMITAYDWNHGTVMNMKEARRMNSGLYQGQVEHKYDYSANQFDVRTWGWSSSSNHVGIWFINPSVEYLSGGPTKVELSAHRDATFGNNPDAPAPPTLLNYWRSSHYGGSICSIGATDSWTKVIGPFLIYCNAGPSADAMWKDALARGAEEMKTWPYDWVGEANYPHRAARGMVSGKLILKDPQAPHARLTNLLVGLAVQDYTPARISRGGFGGFGLAGGGDDDTNAPAGNFGLGGFGRGTNEGARFANLGGTNSAEGGAAFGAAQGTNTNRGVRRGRFGRGGFGFGFGGFGPRVVEWQNNARDYQFWVRGDAKGNFTIPNIRPGVYTLHAMADGVLGEFAVSNVTVAAGKKLELGKLIWQPVRHGKQVWEIGNPNRSGAEFFKGDDYYHWGWYLEYPKLFPKDVNYIVGKSDFRRDWFFEQIPHNEDPSNTTGTGTGRGTTWSVEFNLPSAPRGQATLRLAICGVGTRNLTATVNEHPIGSLTNLMYNATINRDGISGSWSEHDLAFDASILQAGENVLQLSIPAGSLTSGIMYDYIRLELDESAPPSRPGG
jgi:rhamnogalacturonan endolyase